MADVNKHDLEAIGDVAAWLAEQSDSLPPAQAAELLTEARKVAKALSMAISLLEAQLLSTIEQPVLVGNTVWSKVPAMKKRPDQQRIARLVVMSAALPDENGELPTANEAAAEATRMMSALYVSPSTVPKVGGLKQLGVEYGDFITDEHTGWDLKQTEIPT
jgi:hypothetical protein